MIKTENLSFSYGEGQSVLNDINIEIEDGAFVAVLGHNGSGKSTFAKHLNAILLPTGGKAYVFGTDTSDENMLDEIRRHVGMVFQNPDNQIVATVVEEDVAFGPENLGVEPSEIKRRVDEALSLVGMSEFSHAAPHNLSGGQKQRIAIAGIIAMQPSCIVLDEPTAMLDPHGRKDVMKVLHELNRREGVTIILITHYMDEVIDADKVFVMDDGKLVMQGKPREIFSQVDRLKELRLDVPQVTELAYELKKSGLDMPDGILTHEEFRDALKKCMADAGAPKNGGAK